MIQLIVNAFVEKEKTGAVVEILYASSDHEKVKAKYEELVAQYPDNYLAIYDVPLDTDLNTLDHYPSVWIGKEEFEQSDSRLLTDVKHQKNIAHKSKKKRT